MVVSYQMSYKFHSSFHNNRNDVSFFTYFLQDGVIPFLICPARPRCFSPNPHIHRLQPFFSIFFYAPVFVFIQQNTPDI